MELPKKTPAPIEEKRPSEDRIVMLSDGVFAIAMTLLVLDIRLPDNPSGSTTVLKALIALSPKIISYVISFIMIASYWSMHRRIMHYLQRIDNSFIQLNVLLLFFVTALPISTTFVYQPGYTDTNDQKLLFIIYTLSLVACGLTVTALWLNATWKHRLVDPALEQDNINYLLLRLSMVPCFFLLSLLLLLFPIEPYYIYFSWFLLSPLFMILRRVRHRLFPHVTAEFTQENTLRPLTALLATAQHHRHLAAEGTASEHIAKAAVPDTGSSTPDTRSNGTGVEAAETNIKAADARQ